MLAGYLQHLNAAFCVTAAATAAAPPALAPTTAAPAETGSSREELRCSCIGSTRSIYKTNRTWLCFTCGWHDAYLAPQTSQYQNETQL